MDEVGGKYPVTARQLGIGINRCDSIIRDDISARIAPDTRKLPNNMIPTDSITSSAVTDAGDYPVENPPRRALISA